MCVCVRVDFGIPEGGSNVERDRDMFLHDTPRRLDPKAATPRVTFFTDAPLTIFHFKGVKMKWLTVRRVCKALSNGSGTRYLRYLYIGLEVERYAGSSGACFLKNLELAGYLC